MGKHSNGGPAFPQQGTRYDEDAAERVAGMSRRDYLTGQALAGMATAPRSGEELAAWDPHGFARCAIAIADAALEELGRTSYDPK